MANCDMLRSLYELVDLSYLRSRVNSRSDNKRIINSMIMGLVNINCLEDVMIGGKETIWCINDKSR